MIKQAELHREALEKEFNNGLERIRAESDKAISEQRKLREEYARSCPLDNGDKTLQGVVDNQGMAIYSLQISVLQKQKERIQQELREANDKHESSLRSQKELYKTQARLYEEERRKNNQLKEELRLFEDNVLKGIMSSESKAMPKSRTGSPVSPKPKRIKIGVEKPKVDDKHEGSSSEDKIGIKKESPQDDGKALKLLPIYFDENDKMHYEETTAYTTSTRDKSNILIVKKDPKAIRSAADTIREATKPKVLCAHLIKHQPRLPTQEEISIVLNAWRAMLRSTGDYYPDKKKTPEEHLFDLKVLMGARGSFNRNRDTPIARHQWKHQEYGPIQRQYFIPSEYMAPDAFFEKFKNEDDNQIVYYKRICSVRDYYEMLSHDNPQYQAREPNQDHKPQP
jgi:hypothetical protein